MLNLQRMWSTRPAGGRNSWDDVMLRVRASVTVLIIYWCLLFVATHVPSQQVLVVSHINDKVAHGTAYAGLALLLAWVGIGRRRVGPGAFLAIWSIVALYGAFDECTQWLVPRRTTDPWDWLADIAGAGVGLAAYVVGLWLLGTNRGAHRRDPLRTQ